MTAKRFLREIARIVKENNRFCECTYCKNAREKIAQLPSRIEEFIAQNKGEIK